MIAAFATIAFLAAAWVAIVAIAGSLEFTLPRIGSALHGEAPTAAALPVTGWISQRYPTSRSQRVRARPSMRAAA